MVWSRVVDVVVAGSGAAGLAAAILAHDGGADVVVLEKAELIGGTSAVSGGVIWVPGNHHISGAGADSRAGALAYLRRLTLGREPDDALLEVYVHTASEMLEYLERETPLRTTPLPEFSDYYANVDGGSMGGRSVEPAPFTAGEALGEHVARLRTSPHMAPLTMAEGAKSIVGFNRGLIEQRERQAVRVLGAALIAALFRGLVDRNVTVETGVAVRDLMWDCDSDAIVGVEVASTHGAESIGVRRGVVLACGGFEWNERMVDGFIGQRLRPLSPPHNEGDGHRMAMKVGAAFANMRSHWGQPTLHDPTKAFEGKPLMEMASSRGAAGTLIVNRHGVRFANEAIAYNDFPGVFAAYDSSTLSFPNEPPVWMIFDERVKRSTYILPSLPPDEPLPEWIARAGTVEELANRIDVEESTLLRTVARYNSWCEQGHDGDFGRGTAWYEAFKSGGPSPAKSLRSLEEPPYYAVELHNGTLGTNGGPVIDLHARVLRYDGTVIDGLYAAGNLAACVFGPAYPGAGATLGPALTFGYLAGRHAAAQRPKAV